MHNDLIDALQRRLHALIGQALHEYALYEAATDNGERAYRLMRHVELTLDCNDVEERIRPLYAQAIKNAQAA